MTVTAGTGVTGAQVRDELESLLERDLLGPRDGPDEELRPGELPAERYLLGRLVPRPRDVVTEPADDTDPTAPEYADVELAEDPAPVDGDSDEARDSAAAVHSGTMAASAIGLSFLVPGDVHAVAVTPRWGRYRQQPSTTAVTEQGRPRQAWKRTPGGGRALEIRLDGDRVVTTAADDGEGVTVVATIRPRTDSAGPLRHVHVALVNGLEPLAPQPDRNRLYQAEIEVTALDGHAAVFVGHNDPDLAAATHQGDHERGHLDLLHRRVRKSATGSCRGVVAKRHHGNRMERGPRRRPRSLPAPRPAGAMPTCVMRR